MLDSDVEFEAIEKDLQDEFVHAFWLVIKSGITADLIGRYSDFERWRQLSSDSKQFNEELTILFKDTRIVLNMVFGVQTHKIPSKLSRDREIWQIEQQHPSWSLAHIGRPFGLKGPAVKSALLRQDKREQKRRRSTRELHSFLMKWIKHFKNLPAPGDSAAG